MAAFAAGVAVGAVLAAGAALFLYRRHRQLMGRFFSFAAHEINTPITAVNMTILNLLSGVFGDLPVDQVQWIEMMREQVVRLAGMVGEMRDVIHLRLREDLLVHVEQLDPKELCETALRAVRFGCGHSGVPLESQIEETLPSVVVIGDPDRLPRCLATLLFHARKFRTNGALVFTAAKEASRMSVTFRVEFQGTPMPREEAAQSLDLYFPGRQQATHGMTATGLGLGIVKELARLQGGDLFYDTDGKGNYRLRLMMPARPAAGPTTPAPAKDL